MDCLLSDDTTARGRIREIHPEFCFWGLAGRPMQHAKKRTEGLVERTQLLQSIYPGTTDIIDHALSTYRRKDVARDDILDALAAAVTGLLAGQDLAHQFRRSPSLMNAACGWRWYIARTL